MECVLLLECLLCSRSRHELPLIWASGQGASHLLLLLLPLLVFRHPGFRVSMYILYRTCSLSSYMYIVYITCSRKRMFALFC